MFLASLDPSFWWHFQLSHATCAGFLFDRYRFPGSVIESEHCHMWKHCSRVGWWPPQGADGRQAWNYPKRCRLKQCRQKIHSLTPLACVFCSYESVGKLRRSCINCSLTQMRGVVADSENTLVPMQGSVTGGTPQQALATLHFYRRSNTS